MSTSTQHDSAHAHHDENHGNLKSYIVGFVLSIVLTLLAFGAVAFHWFSFAITVAFIVILAVGQLFVQLVLFLHLNEDSKPYWNISAIVFAALIVFVVVAASIWIMYHLNINMQM